MIFGSLIRSPLLLWGRAEWGSRRFKISAGTASIWSTKD